MHIKIPMKLGFKKKLLKASQSFSATNGMFFFCDKRDVFLATQRQMCLPDSDFAGDFHGAMALAKPLQSCNVESLSDW